MRVGVAALTTACTLIGMHAPLASSAEPSSEHPDTALIIDASGSMWAPDGSGELRTNTANRVAHTLLGELPGDQQLALLTYGTGTGNSDEEKEAQKELNKLLAKPLTPDKTLIEKGYRV